MFANNPDIKVVGDRFVFQSEVLFASGEATLSASGSGDLDKFAMVYQQLAARLPPDLPVIIEVQGHTDRVPVRGGRFASNWELSTARACAVGRALILEGGMPSERLIMTGLGDQQPLQPNTSAANMAVNRRIDLVLSVENPTDALADEKIAAATQENMRRWMVKSDTGQGEGTWNAKR